MLGHQILVKNTPPPRGGGRNCRIDTFLCAYKNEFISTVFSILDYREYKVVFGKKVVNYTDVELLLLYYSTTALLLLLLLLLLLVLLLLLLLLLLFSSL